MALNTTHIFVTSRKMFAKLVSCSKNYYFTYAYDIKHMHINIPVCIKTVVQLGVRVGAAGGEWYTCHREQNPRGNKINILNEKHYFLKAPTDSKLLSQMKGKPLNNCGFFGS